MGGYEEVQKWVSRQERDDGIKQKGSERVSGRICTEEERSRVRWIGECPKERETVKVQKREG